MDQEEKINYLRMAAGMVGLHFKESDLDKLVSVYDGILKKKGKYTVEDAVHDVFEAEKREEVREKERIRKKFEKDDEFNNKK